MKKTLLEISPTRLEVESRSAEQFVIRTLSADDTEALSAYFRSLSEQTRSLFGPHPFTRQEARRITSHLDSEELVRYGVFTDRRMVGYFLLLPGVNESDAARYREYDVDLVQTATYAPSVCDEYHGRGIGTAAFAVIRAAAEAAGFRRIVLMGGVQGRNTVARAYYRRLGFKEIGRFQTRVDNFDMMLDLSPA